MNERTQKALDGDLPRQELSPAEAAELAAAEAGIDIVLRTVPVATLPDLAPAVMRRIEELEAGRRASGATVAAMAESADLGGASASRTPIRDALAWIWRPRRLALSWRPAYAFALVAAVALVLPLRPEPVVTSPAAQRVLTQFVLDAPDARQVVLAGDFTNWQPSHELTRTEAGVWTVVVALDPGIHNYAFVVDGERWTPDPNAPAVSDGFGGLNSRLAVLAPDEAEL